MTYPDLPYAYRSCCLGVPAPTLLAATEDDGIFSMEFRPRFANGYLTYHVPTSSGQQTSTTYTGQILDLNGNQVAPITLVVDGSDAVTFACAAAPAIVDTDGRLIVREIIDLANENVPGSGTGVLWLEIHGAGDITTATILWEPA